jgi:hypothetical protein
LSASSRGKKWRPVDANEIKTFLGMIIVMEYVRKAIYRTIGQEMRQ